MIIYEPDKDFFWLPLFAFGKPTEPEANGYPSKHALNTTINPRHILRCVAAHVEAQTTLLTLTFPIINVPTAADSWEDEVNDPQGLRDPPPQKNPPNIWEIVIC